MKWKELFFRIIRMGIPFFIVFFAILYSPTVQQVIWVIIALFLVFLVPIYYLLSHFTPKREKRTPKRK